MIDLLHVSREAHCTRVSYQDKATPRTPSKRPFIIPVFLPQAGCPHQCAFCNQHTISGTRHRVNDRTMFSAAVEQFLSYRRPAHGVTQLAFFGGNFLGLPAGRISRCLDWAATYVQRGDADSLRFSTRPDTISPETLAQIRDYPVRTVELGVQTMDDAILARSQRGHNAADTRRAVSHLKAAGYEIGLQLMTGLPGDNFDKAIATTEAIIGMAPAFVRIYPTLVLAGSPLAADHAAGRYQPPRLAESIDLVARMWLMLTAAGIRVVRMGLQDGPALTDRTKVLAGPYHPAFGERVLSRVFGAMAETALNHSAPVTGRIILRVNPRRISVMAGPRRSNLEQIQDKYRLDRIRIKGDKALLQHQMEVDNI